MNTIAESVITLTESAVRQLQDMLAGNADHAGKCLRVYVEAGGCSGMQYGLVFDERREGDLTAEHGTVGVVVDAFSAPYLRGAVVDYDDSLTGGGFRIANPNARVSCGCGNSFEAPHADAARPVPA